MEDDISSITHKQADTVESMKQLQARIDDLDDARWCNNLEDIRHCQNYRGARTPTLYHGYCWPPSYHNVKPKACNSTTASVCQNRLGLQLRLHAKFYSAFPYSGIKQQC
ncbi:Hypothetical predicted protein [Pelobates cultripes]|uniref:Uncharacterized protein n=1 Tax=Pelobates cultripes TaxID=61616 RepID=A0AAD1S2J6_PELCU|nr:Hypothetical predicted protein [Pelobates cultripes]